MAAPEELRPLYLRVHEAFEAEDYAAAVQGCDQILAQAPEEADARAARAIAALLDGDFEKALMHADAGQLDLERAYALYRLDKGEEALAVLAGSARAEEEAYLHLKGQTLFKLGRYGAAAEAFAAVAARAEDGGAGDVELMTNAYAALVAAGRGREALARFPVDEAAREACYELAFLTGAALLDAEEWEAAEARLREAQAVCRRLGEEEELDAEGKLNEAAAIHLELAYVLAVRGKRSEAFEHLTTLIHKAAKLSDPVVAVLAVNNVAALKADAPGAKGGSKAKEEQLAGTAKKLEAGMEAAQDRLMPRQRLLLTINRSLLAIRGGKAEEAEAALGSLSKEEQGSWRVAMARVALKMMKDGSHDPEGELKALLASLLQQKQGKGAQEGREDGGREALEGERSVGTALAQVLVNRGRLKEAAAVLEGLTTLQGYPAHVATLASLHARAGDTGAALAAFDRGQGQGEGLPLEARIKVLQGAASVRSRYGQHAEAAKAWKELLDGEATGEELDGEERMKALAALVIATSWFDEEEAQALAAGLPVSALPIFDHLDGIDAAALESAGLPRGATGGSRRISRAASASALASVPASSLAGSALPAAAGADAGAGKKGRRRKADPEKAKRKREKACLAYIEKLKAEGKYDPSKKPDPERWIPKSQRSYNKRGRKARGRFVGAQGSGDGAQKDAAKLDVASRVAAQKKKDAEDAEARAAALLAGGRRKKR